MRTEPDGFKHPEGNDSKEKGILATYENTVLLHEQIRELREAFELLLQKLEVISQPFNLFNLTKEKHEDLE